MRPSPPPPCFEVEEGGGGGAGRDHPLFCGLLGPVRA